MAIKIAITIVKMVVAALEIRFLIVDIFSSFVCGAGWWGGSVARNGY
jgi:hypothetical protein